MPDADYAREYDAVLRYSHAAFAAALVAAPHDRTARNAFADYLRDQGHEAAADHVQHADGVIARPLATASLAVQEAAADGRSAVTSFPLGRAERGVCMTFPAGDQSVILRRDFSTRDAVAHLRRLAAEGWPEAAWWADHVARNYPENT